MSYTVVAQSCSCDLGGSCDVSVAKGQAVHASLDILEKLSEPHMYGYYFAFACDNRMRYTEANEVSAYAGP